MKRAVAVVVVGDLARSPRMVNHARELARLGVPVWLMGLREREFDEPGGVQVLPLRGWRSLGKRGLPGAALRMVLTGGQLLAALLRLRPGAILIQNPPAFPTMLAGWLAACLRRTPLLVDWHNPGHSMVALRVGPNHPVTALARRHEVWMGRRAQAHFCVSYAMSVYVESQLLTQPVNVLRDRPLQRISHTSGGGPRIVAVCPGGWTADEDMAMLLDALALPAEWALEVHLTGDGPLRAELEPRVAALRDAGLDIHTGYLSEPDYWSLIARSDVGISMHRSSSGLDLAMKVVDLFSAGTPVCAFDYGPTVREQISEGETGFLFRTAAELAAILKRLQRDRTALLEMRSRVEARWGSTWTEEWHRVAAPVFRRLL